MAAGTRLVLRFGTTSGEKNFTYRYGNAEALASDVKSLMETMITNGSIFKYPPLTIISAKAEVTSETTFNVS